MKIGIIIAGAVGLAAVLLFRRAKAVENGENGGIQASINFTRQKVCLTSRGDRCLEFSDDERIGKVIIKNKGVPARLTTRLVGWLYLDGSRHSQFAEKEWTTDFGSGQQVSYSFDYMVPITGMNFDSRFFITVEDSEGNFVAAESFIKSL